MKEVDALKRYVAFFLAFVLCFSLTAALAEHAKVQTPGGWLNMRAKPSTKAAPLKQVPNHATVTFLEETDDEWSHITYQGVSGYVQTKYLNLTQTAEGKTVYPSAEGAVYIRKTASDQGEIMAVLSFKDALTVIDVGDEWTKVSYQSAAGDSGEGYVLTNRIEDRYEEPQSAPVYMNETGVLLKNHTLYEHPSTSSPKSASLPKGEKVTVLYMEGGWCKVKADFITSGYLPVSALSLTGEEASQPENNLLSYTATYYLCTVPSGTLPVYAEPTGDLEGNLSKTIPVDPSEKLPVVQHAHQSHGAAWAQVICNDAVYWTPTSAISVTDETDTMYYERPVEQFTGGTVYARKGAKLYASGSRYSPVLATIPEGTELEAGLREEVLSVTYNGMHGYLFYDDVICGLAQYIDQDDGWYFWQHMDAPAPTPTPAPTPLVDESKHITAKKARSQADAALKSAYQVKSTSGLQVSSDKVYTSRGQTGPFYEFAYFKDGKYLYNVLIHAETGATAFTANYTDFNQTVSSATKKPQKETDKPGEINKKTARSTADQLLRSTYGGFDDNTYSVVNERFESMPGYDEPVFRLNYYAGETYAYTCVVGAKTGKVHFHTDVWSGANTELDYSTPTPPPVYESTVDIGRDKAISIAKSALAGKYPDFDASKITRIDCKLYTEHGHLPLPYYYINFFVTDSEFYSCAVNAYTGEVQETYGNLPGEGNG